MLVLTAAVMLVVTITILTFRMLMSLSLQLEHSAFFPPGNAMVVGAGLNTLWITLMDQVCRNTHKTAQKDSTRYVETHAMLAPASTLHRCTVISPPSSTISRTIARRPSSRTLSS